MTAGTWFENETAEITMIDLGNGAWIRRLPGGIMATPYLGQLLALTPDTELDQDIPFGPPRP